MNEVAIKRGAALPVNADRSKAFFYLRLVFGVLLLAGLFRMLDLPRLAATLAGVKLGVVALGLLAMSLNLLAKTYRWGLILREQRPDISLSRLARLNFTSLFLGNFLPTSFSHDFVRVYYVARGSGDARAAISSIFADRVIGNLSVAVAAVAAFIALKVMGLLPIGPLLSYGVLIFLLASLALPLALLNGVVIGAVSGLLDRIAGRKLFGNVDELSRHLLSYRERVPLMGKVLAVAFLNLAIAVVEFYLIARSLSAAPALHYFFLFVPLVVLFSMLPVSVGGLGLLEAGLVFFFSAVGLTPETAVGIALLHRAMQLVCLLPGGVLYLWKGMPSLAG